MVGKKVHRQPEQVRLCKHRHAERAAESVGAVVEEKKHEDLKPTRRGVWNIAVELGMRWRFPLSVSRSNARVVVVNAVEMHERQTETTATVFQSPPSRRKIA